MNKSLFAYIFFLIASFQTMQLNGMDRNLPIAAKADSQNTKTLLEIGDDLLKRCNYEKSPKELHLLLRQATNNYEQAYLSDQACPNSRVMARIKLEKIYAQYPYLKSSDITRLLKEDYEQLLPSAEAWLLQAAQNHEDYLLQAVATHKMPIIERQNFSNDEDKISIYLNSKGNRNIFSQRIFGDDIERITEEKLAKERAEKLTKAKEVAEKRAQELAAKQAKEKEVAEKARTQQIEKNRIAQKTVSNAKKVKLAAKKAKDNFSIDDALLETADMQMKNRQFEEAAQTYWSISQQSNTQKNIDLAADQLQFLYTSKKSIEAGYYAVLLLKNEEEKINLFLKIENQRDLKIEQEQGKWVRNRTGLIQDALSAQSVPRSPAMKEAEVAIRKFKGNVQALHGLILHNANQAVIFPEMKIPAFRSIAGYTMQLHNAKNPFPEGYDYAKALNNLAVALYERAKQTIESKNTDPVNSNLMKIVEQEINEAHDLLNISHKQLEHVASGGNLAKVLEFRCKHFKEINTLDESVVLYVDALKNGSCDITPNIETLLIEGINNYPLPYFQREKLIKALKEYKPESALFSSKDFNESAYFTTAQKDKSKGSMEFYQGLYWFDKGDNNQSASFMKDAASTKYNPANLFNHYTMLSEKILTGQQQDALNKIQDSWKLIPALGFPYGALLNSATINSLKQLIDNVSNKNTINAEDMINILHVYLQGIQARLIQKDPAAVKTVCVLLDESEWLLAQNSNLSNQNKLFDDTFISNLLSFSKQFKNDYPLYSAAGCAITQLKQSSNETLVPCALKLITSITHALNDNLNISESDPNCEEKTKITEKIDQLIASSQQKEYLPALESLQSVLQGQKIEIKKAGTMQGVSEKFIKFYQDQTAHAGANIILKNDQEIISSLRVLIEQFRKANMRQQYRLLRNQFNIMTTLEAYTVNKVAKYLQTNDTYKPTQDTWNSLLALIKLHLILIADNSLMKENFPVEEALKEACSTFSTLGIALIAQELVADSLFAPNKAKAREYINLARTKIESFGKNPEELQFITKVEKLINECPD